MLVPTGRTARTVVVIGMLMLWSATSLGCRRASAQNQPVAQGVSIIELIAAPERFQDKRVNVIGFLHLEFEGNAIYLHEEDYKHRVANNALWVNLSKEARKQPTSLSDRYVVVEATFDGKNRGHNGMFSGTLKDVTRLEPWR